MRESFVKKNFKNLLIVFVAYVDSSLEAIFTVSPNKQYLGLVFPTTSLTTGPFIRNSSEVEFRKVL
jgi:hypothetical protein